MEFCPYTMPKIIQAKNMIAMFDHMFDNNEIALTILSRYHYNGRYHIEPQEAVA